MDKALQTMIENMPAKTGKSLEEWKKILRAKGFEKHGQAVKFLKESHHVTHGFANTIVALSKEDNATEDELVRAQFKGKESLKPIYEKLLAVVEKFGKDVNVLPKKTTVSIVRKKQFALIKPATKTRIDLGLKIRGKDSAGRLENSGPFGSMCTHRVRLEKTQEVDNELKEWLKEAYLQAD